MTKYSKELKFNLANEYLNSMLGYTLLAQNI